MIASSRRAGVSVDIVRDLSVGNTTIGYGLYRIVEQTPDWASIDLVIIEYALNDEFIYSRDLVSLRHWARLYEGCIRALRIANPEILVFSVILSRRGGQFVDRIPLISASITY